MEVEKSIAISYADSTSVGSMEEVFRIDLITRPIWVQLVQEHENLRTFEF